MLLAGSAIACVGATRGVPLYVSSGPRRELTEVAQLYGELGSVDGQDVSGKGQSFELLPGCHVVATRTSWGKKEGFETYSGNMPRLEFVIHMQANRSYVFETDLVNRTGSGGTLGLTVREKDATGNVTASYQPAATQAEIDRCRPPEKNVGRGR